MNAKQRNAIVRAAQNRDPYGLRDVLSELSTYDLRSFKKDLLLTVEVIDGEFGWRDRIKALGLVSFPEWGRQR